MSIDRISRHYLDEQYQREAFEFGTTMAYSPGGILAGFRNPNAPEEIAKFAGHLWPDGTPMLQPHGDRERSVYNQIGSFSREFNAKASTLRPDEFRKLTGWALEAAMETDAAVIEPRTFVRTGAGGRSRVEALPLVHYSVHGVNRRGDINIHVNCVRLRAGITKAGEAYSLADNRMPYRAQREWNEQFQLRVADKVERGLGWEIEMKNGRAVPRDVHPAMVAARGGRRREMEAYLDAKGIKHSPPALAVAALATQPPKREFKLDERLKTWKQEARQQVQQWDESQSRQQKPPAKPAQQQPKPSAPPRPTQGQAQPSAKPAPPQRPSGPGIASQSGPGQDQAKPKQAPRAKPQPGPAQPQNGQVMGPAGSGQFVLPNQPQGPRAQPRQGQGQQQARQAQAGQGQTKQARQRPSPQAGQGHTQQQKRGSQPVARIQARGKKASGQGQSTQGQGARNAQGQGFGYTARPSGAADPAPQQSKGRWGRLADGLAQEIKLRARFAKEVWRTYRANGAKREVRVDNVASFLQDTRRRSRLEGHLAARRSLREADWQKLGLKGTLQFAREAYKQGREPALKVAKGAKVVIRHDAPAMSPGEFRSLMARAEKGGWDVRLCGHHKSHWQGKQQGQATGSQRQSKGQQKAQNQGQQANAQQQGQSARSGRTQRRSTP